MNVDTRTDPTVLVDIENGTVLDAPPTAVVSRRWADSHDFVDTSRTHLFAGPDAEDALAGISNRGDYVDYVIEREIAGFLHLRRIA